MEAILILILLLWLIGAFVVPVGGKLIHILLVVVAVIVLFRLLGGRQL